MTVKLLQRIVKDMTGLKLYLRPKCQTTYYYQSPQLTWINLNILEIKKATQELMRRGFQIKGIFLQVILHEIAHDKLNQKRMFFQIMSLIAKQESHSNYSVYLREEKICDRYAKLNYKKVLKAYENKT